jgi:quinoprotein glucose dehydrogenase
MKKKNVAAPLIAALAFCSVAHAQQGMRDGEWRYWGGDAGSTRYSTLDQINASNARELQIAWRWQSLPGDGEPDSNLQATPLMIDGVLYTSTGVHQAAAVDPKTGTTLWVFTPEPRKLDARGGVQPSGRGVAYWSDGREKRLFLNTVDGRLIAIDARTGKADPKFGANGTVSMVGSSSPPIAVGNILVAQTPSDVRGYDVRTGKSLWIVDGGVSTMMSADDELGYVYLPGGAGIVCVNARTGKRVWDFQIVHHDVWNYGLSAAPILGDIKLNGRRIRSVTLLTNQAMSFVFDRRTGKPVWPIEERPVPGSDVPGDRLSPTQPFPTKPLPYERLGYNEEDLIDFTPWLRSEALDIAKQYVRGPMYMPPSRAVEGGSKGTWMNPGYGGGTSWNGGAFDPETGMMYVPTRNQPMADPTTIVPGPRGLPIVKPPWSRVTATDMNTGEHRWSKSIGPASDFVKNHPDLRGLKLDFANMGQVGASPSPLLTRTLLFLGESMFRAYDKATGAVVAEIEMPSKTTSAPITYLYEGRQYIVVAVSNRDHPAELVALTLPDKPKAQSATPAAQPVVADTAEIRNGRQVFATSCAICHGRGGEGVAGGPPALTSVRDPARVRQMVTYGGAEMPALQSALTEQQIHDVAEYVAAGLPPEPKQQP